MGIFGGGRGQQASGRVAVVQGPRPAADVVQPVLCDRCHVALAKIEVITGAGSVFLCSHHCTVHRNAILGAGHQIRSIRSGFFPGL
jgi:hypothetical protein